MMPGRERYMYMRMIKRTQDPYSRINYLRNSLIISLVWKEHDNHSRGLRSTVAFRCLILKDQTSQLSVQTLH